MSSGTGPGRGRSRAGVKAASIGALIAVLAAGCGAGEFDFPILPIGSPPPNPSVSTQQADNITSRSAVLHGTVNPRGISTKANFDWGGHPSLAYSISTYDLPVGAGTSGVPVAQTLTGLASGTKYWFRAAAVNFDGGYAYGSIQSFTTPPDGASRWARSYSVAGDSTAFAVVAHGGGFLLAGYAARWGGYYWDAWVISTDNSGTPQWQKTYGGEGSDMVLAAARLADGGYAVAGSLDNATTPGTISRTFWVMALGANGTVRWQRILGTGTAYAVRQAADGGLIVAGETFAAPGARPDALVAKIALDGNVLWNRTYGGPGEDVARALETGPGGRHLVVGWDNSSGGGGFDAWVLMLEDADGSVAWQKRYGGQSSDDFFAYAVCAAADNGYVVAGYAGVGGAPGLAAMKIRDDGAVAWTRAFGTTLSQFSRRDVARTGDGGFAIAEDRRIVKLDADGNLLWARDYGRDIEAIARTPGGDLAAAGSYTYLADASLMKIGPDGYLPPVSSPVTPVDLYPTVTTADTSVVPAPGPGGVAASAASVVTYATVQQQAP